MNTRKTVNRSATDRLKHLVRAELTRQELSDARAAREARLPGSVFQSLLRLGKRPTIDRAAHSGEIDHRFRPKPITHSGRNRSLIPVETDHPFRPKPITRPERGDAGPES